MWFLRRSKTVMVKIGTLNISTHDIMLEPLTQDTKTTHGVANVDDDYKNTLEDVNGSVPQNITKYQEARGNNTKTNNDIKQFSWPPLS